MFLCNLLFWENSHIFKWTLTSIYTHRVITLQKVRVESYEASKNHLQDLKHFPTFRMFFTILPKTIFTRLNRSRGIEHQSKVVFDWSNRYWASIESCRNFRSIFLTNSIDRTTWNLNFHKENSKSQNTIFSFYKWILSNLISLLQSILVYSFIYNINLSY